MSDRNKTLSLRQFRERAPDITESVDIAVRDRDGNLRIIGFYTPYRVEPVTYPVTVKGTGRIEEVELPPVEITVPGPKVIRTPEEVAAVVTRGQPFPKSAQTGRKRTK